MGCKEVRIEEWEYLQFTPAKSELDFNQEWEEYVMRKLWRAKFRLDQEIIREVDYESRDIIFKQ